MTTVDQELGYLEAQPYLQDAPYLSSAIQANMGMQVLIQPKKFLGMQMNRATDFEIGQQQETNILDYPRAFGFQQQTQINQTTPLGMQQLTNIVDFQKPYGMQQQTRIVDFQVPLGAQADWVTSLGLGMEYELNLYSPKRFRFMCEFPSRGRTNATGTNEWGNAAGQGLNWKANSTEPGDFDVSNVNNDIVEKVWRSATGTTSGINLDCDTERPQGIPIDTLALINTNLTSSATVNLIASNASDFSVIEEVIGLSLVPNERNVYYVAAELPISSYKFWRISIDDSQNADNFISIGTIVFGSATTFNGECIVDEVEFELADYAAKVPTEGYSNVSNSRAQRKKLRVEFRQLSYGLGNFQAMRNHFRFARTTLKCLYIPTPDPERADFTARFAVFSKMVKVPTERHKVIGPDADYVSFTLELDESE